MNRYIAIIALAVLLFSCTYKIPGNKREGFSMGEKRTIEQVQEAYTDKWMQIPGVQGTGIGLFEDKPCIKVFSSVPAEELKDKIPSVVEGYPVIIEKTGTFRALDQ